MKLREPMLRSPEPELSNYPFGDSMLTDAVLDELKRQSINGCFLCSFDELDLEDWD